MTDHPLPARAPAVDQPAGRESRARRALGWVRSRPPAGEDVRWYQSLSWWASLVLLAAAAGILVWSLVGALAYTMTHPGPPCSNPPALQAVPPQVVVVAGCLAAFVLGHFTSRLQYVDARHAGRHSRPSRSPYQEPRRREMLIIQALLLVFLIEVAGLLVIEMVTLSRGVWPITYYIRCAYNAAGVETALGAAAISFLVGRWFWLPRRKHARTGT